MRHIFGVLVLSVFLSVCSGEGQFDLSKLRKDRPRLMLTDGRLSELKELAKSDEALAKCVKDSISTADSYCKKSKQLYIEGSIQTRSWEDKESGQKRYTTEILVNQMVMLGRAGDDGGGEFGGQEMNQERPEPAGAKSGGGGGFADEDDDLPF